MRRTIQAPGVEIRETDISEYNKTDYSIVGTTSLVCGFAGKGDPYKINWINTVQNFIETFGAPETEEEKFFYNAGAEVLTKGGILLAAKLPYDNFSNKNYTYSEYQLAAQNVDISADYTDGGYPHIYSLDTTLRKCKKITAKTIGYASSEDFDAMRVSPSSKVANRCFRIVDITKSQYEKCQTVHYDTASEAYTKSEQECIGVLPVVTTAQNAAFFQQLFTTETSVETSQQAEKTDKIEFYSPIGGSFKVLEQQSPYTFDLDNFTTPLYTGSINDTTVGKLAASYFPTLSYTDTNTLDTQYLKDIGIVVFQMFKDTASKTKIGFKAVESFIGSLDRTAKTEEGASRYIDSIVNTQSKYINVFTNCQPSEFKDIDMLATSLQDPTSLGFLLDKCSKTISYKDSIITPLALIYDQAKDTNKYNIDLVVDAGVSNIAQKAISGSSTWPNATKREDTNAWRAVQQKMVNFCSSTRKDCMAILDGLRSFCLDNDQKLVRDTAVENTVLNQIIPKLKLMSGLNTSYAAGYCNWFLAYDSYSGDLIWLPPSIKTAGTYIYTDAYFNKWDAPAGMSRGKINNIVDCAFSPSQSEAEKIYLQSWNYAVSYPIDGIVTEGQKTFQLKPTAFDRVNVRRLFLHLEKEVARIAKFFLYEGNTEYQRTRFVDSIRPIFENAVNKNGVLEYYIKCDEENNTVQAIENNELHCAIAVKPVKSIEFIVLNFVCTNQSAAVTEVLQGM